MKTLCSRPAVMIARRELQSYTIQTVPMKDLSHVDSSRDKASQEAKISSCVASAFNCDHRDGGHSLDMALAFGVFRAIDSRPRHDKHCRDLGRALDFLAGFLVGTPLADTAGISCRRGSRAVLGVFECSIRW